MGEGQLREALTWFHWCKQLLLLPHTAPGLDKRAAQTAPATGTKKSGIAQEPLVKLTTPALP